VAARDHLSQAFGCAAPEHFVWQTTAPFVSDRERDLVRAAFLPLGERVLDVGCGEGATLVHLGAPAGATGIDLFDDKIEFARRRLPSCSFIAGSAEQLPFSNGRFDHVIVRDLIHHLDEPSRAVDEIVRVLVAGGRVDVLEPCGYNPLIALHAITRPAERLELRSNATYLRDLLGSRLQIETVRHHQAFPIHRLIFHPDVGRPALATNPIARRVTEKLEQFSSWIMPKWAWAYIHVRARLRVNGEG